MFETLSGFVTIATFRPLSVNDWSLAASFLGVVTNSTLSRNVTFPNLISHPYLQ